MEYDRTMHHQHLLRIAFAIGVFGLTLCAEVRAEIVYRIPGDFGWRKSIPLQLILDKDVIDDLELSPAAASKLRQLHEQIQVEIGPERQKSINAIPKPQAADRWVRRYQWNDAILHTARKRHTDELNELLSSQQQERLHQIHIQRQRKLTDALCDPAVAAELGLTDTQRTEIRQRCWEVVKAEMDEVKGKGKSNGPNSATLDNQLPETLIKILSDEQRQAFERFQGRPLNPSLKLK